MDQWQPAQVQQLQEIGPYLQQQREQRGLTVEEVAEKTRIRPGLLRALEAAQVQQLPEPVYLRGFVRRYAELMGLDGNELSTRIKLDPLGSMPDTTKPLEIPPSRKRSWARKGIAALVAIGQKKPSHQVRKGMIIAAAVGGSVLLIGLTYATIWRTRSPQVQRPRLSSPSSPTPFSSPSPEVASLAPEPSSVAPASSTIELPVELNLEIRDTSWIQVVVDGEVEFEGFLDTGEQLTWTAQEQITLLAGRPEAVWISLNGTESVPFGEAGEPKEETFP